MDHTLDRLAIRDLVENWVLWRDAGDWERFRTVWHDDGVMMATWFQGPAEEFIRVSREGWDKGVSILHFLGGTTIDLATAHTVAQTKITISKSEVVESVVLRQPIYEKDRMDPVPQGAAPVLDEATLLGFPEGYRHLAYAQLKIGYSVKRDMPGLKGAEVEALYRRGRAWLAGAPDPRIPVD